MHELKSNFEINASAGDWSIDLVIDSNSQNETPQNEISQVSPAYSLLYLIVCIEPQSLLSL